MNGTALFNDPTFSSLTLSAATLGGSGNLTVTGAFTWLGGTISLPHTTAQSGIDFHGGGDAFLSGVLTNPIGQTTTLGASGGIFLHLQNGATFVNAGTFVGSGDGEIVGDSSSGNTFSNSGTFNVAEASGHTFTLGNNVTFIDSGAVNVQSGTLTVNSSATVSGPVAVASGAMLNLQTGLTWSAGAALSGAGSLIVNAPGSTNDLTPVQFNLSGPVNLVNGTVLFNDSVTFSSLALSGATLAGSGNLTVTGAFSWVGGTLSLPQTIAQSGINFHGGGDAFLSGVLTNPAGQTTTLGAGGGIFLHLQNGATFVNAGTFTGTGDGAIQSSGTGNTFDNSGTFNVAEAPGRTFNLFAGFTFNDSGTLNVQSGKLILSSGGTVSGAVNVASDASLSLQSALTWSAGASLSGAGSLTVNAPSSTNDLTPVQFNLSGPVTLVNGTVLFNDSVNFSSLTLSAGSLGGSGNLSVAGPFTWLGGTLSMSQTTAQGGIDFHGGGDAFLSGVLTNPVGQTTTLGASGGIFLHLQNGATFINAGTLTGSGDGAIQSSGAGNTFNNSGTFNVAEASGHTFNFFAGFTLVDSGAVNVQSGNLILSSDGTVTGPITIASGASLSLQTGLTWSAGAALSGAGGLTVNAFGRTNDLTAVQFSLGGPVTIANGTMLFNDSVTFSSLTLSAGTLGGSGNLTVTGAFTWLGGTLSISQTTAQSGIDFHGGGDAFLSGNLTNPAGATTTLGASGGIFLHLENGGFFTNAGTLTGSGDGAISGDASSGNTFSNTGTFNVAEASGHTFQLTSGFAFNNSGTFNVQSGILSVKCGGTSTAPMDVASGAALNFGSGAGYTLVTPGAIDISYAGNPDPVSSVRLMLFTQGVVAGGGLALAYVDSADGVAGVPPSTILVKPALAGDVNLDGAVNFSDLLTLAQHYGASDALWDHGDLNADGAVGFPDLLILAQNYGKTSATNVLSAAAIKTRRTYRR